MPYRSEVTPDIESGIILFKLFSFWSNVTVDLRTTDTAYKYCNKKKNIVFTRVIPPLRPSIFYASGTLKENLGKIQRFA